MRKASFIIISLILCSISASALQVDSVSYGKYGLVFQGTQQGVTKGMVYDVFRGTEVIGQFYITDAGPTNSKGYFSPVSDNFLPLTVHDRLELAEPVAPSDDEEAPVQVSEDTEETMPSAESFYSLSSSAGINEGYGATVNYIPMGTVGAIPAFSYQVDSDLLDLKVSYGTKNIEASYTRREYMADASIPGASVSQDGGVHRMEVKYSPEKIKLPWTGTIAIGAVYAISGKREYTRPYGVYSTNINGIAINAGVDSIFGDVLYRNGLFLSAGYDLSDKATLFMDYRTVDENKSYINFVLLPDAGINCRHCSLDSLTVGASYAITPQIKAAVALYDMSDLSSLFTSVSYNVGKKLNL